MDLLIVEPFEAEVLQWLQARHPVRYAPELAADLRGFRHALRQARAIIVPPSVALDAQTLHAAPGLRAVGRITSGAENIDLEACARAHVEVVRSPDASAQAEAEFMVGALLSMLRRVPVVVCDGLRVGRELSQATVGLVGLTPAAKVLAQMLGAFGSRVVGYDPAVHASDTVFEQWQIRPRGLRELLEESDAVCVQLNYFSRYQGLLGERLLPFCKPDQVMVCISHSGLFEPVALARALNRGRIAALWLDSVEPGALDPGKPLAGVGGLQVTPRVASTTRESRLRAAWTVAERIDELLSAAPAPPGEFRTTEPGAPLDLEDEPGWR